MTLKKASNLKLTDFNHITVDRTVKNVYNSNNNVITKKETQLLLDYFSGLPVDPKKLEKLHKPAKICSKIKRLMLKIKFIILKEQFNIEKEVVIEMIRTEEKLNLNALAYI